MSSLPKYNEKSARFAIFIITLISRKVNVYFNALLSESNVQPSYGIRKTMLLKRPLKDVGPWRGIFEPSTATSFTEREHVVEKYGLPGALYDSSVALLLPLVVI